MKPNSENNSKLVIDKPGYILSIKDSKPQRVICHTVK